MREEMSVKNQITVSPEVAAEIDKALGLETVTFRIHSETLATYTDLAMRLGMPIQALFRQTLEEAASSIGK